jgi:hypothetical protein
MSPVKVISQQPPGGRCTLYARYADAVGEYLGWPHSVFHSDEPDAHCLPLTVTACWLPWQETFAD